MIATFQLIWEVLIVVAIGIALFVSAGVGMIKVRCPNCKAKYRLDETGYCPYCGMAYGEVKTEKPDNSDTKTNTNTDDK